MAERQTMSQAELDYDNRNDLIAASAALIVTGVLTVILRFWSRWKKRLPLLTDDWLTLAALPLQITVPALGILGVKTAGIGQSTPVVLAKDPKAILKGFQQLFALEFVYNTSLTLVKLSILFLYFRVFPTKFMKWGTLSLGALCLAWWIAVIFTTIFQCTPIRQMWEMDIPGGHCINKAHFFLASSVPNIVIDMLMLVLPIVEIKGLHMQRSRKITVAGVFLLGGGVIVVSCIRLEVVIDLFSSNPEKPNAALRGRLMLWTMIEPTMALLCSCLPTMQPVLNATLGRIGCMGILTRSNKTQDSELNTIGGSRPTAPRSTTHTAVSSDSPFRRLHDNDSAEEAILWVSDQGGKIHGQERSDIVMTSVRPRKD